MVKWLIVCYRCPAISQNQFDTPPPLHCFDSDLQSFANEMKPLSIEVPTIDSHIKQLLRGGYPMAISI